MDSLATANRNPPQPAAGDFVKEGSLAGFATDVVQASMTVPVLVDFWAPWCGPCKTLGPMLEKIVKAAGGKLRLVKINIDEPRNQPLAQQLRVQSIPAVYAFIQGQPVDGFVGALPESQLKQFVERLAGGKLAPDPVEQLLEDAKAALAAGEVDQAGEAFLAASRHQPRSVVALAGLARVALAKGDLAGAKQALAQVPADQANHADIAAATAALAVAEEAQSASGQLGELERRVAENPTDHQARYDLALAAFGAGQRQRAVDELLEVVRRDRNWNDAAARKQLVKLFEALGFADPISIDGRKRLSSILFS
jgi:putative thioredoxin